MSLLALPSEIHQLVISHVHSNQDVASISISCRTLRIVCDMETRKKFDRIRISGNDDSRNAAFALLMAILRRPRLGHYVHHIECNDPTFHLTDYLEREHQRDLSGDDIRRVEIATRKAGFTGPKQDRILNMLMQKTAANTRIMGGKASEYR
ncbi:uncharacterized protein N7479_002996 [Penicillium vulpinum]|uniref:F-box domain-containing protein n=1 Tax=Penicillium vulpinum TaxID=29845 RepID=A0A1V6RGD1_9EURO|nr:uncharacterized protein N7479_002996 [Penicillium vulpinum]KAJ5973078.1 hypothetical protein N7479_002996 [Penicillium vulpinum]OQE00453.1 hypothetical protein PENVUL_c051G06230 [Penicillium vulpinum]